MFESKESKKRRQTRERVRRYRDKKASVTTVTTSVTASKMVHKCLYFLMKDGKLVCCQCGAPSPKVEDKIRRGVEFK